MGPSAEPSFLLDRKWPFRIALGVWVAAGVGAWFAADDLGRPGQVVLAGLWVVGLGLLLRSFLRSLVGPVLAYDILRVGRKPRQIWFRFAYAVILGVMFTWVYLSWVSNNTGRVHPKVMARLAETFFTVYMVVQFIMVCLLTPASVAGAIADEKERRTLEFLLATDLRDREILFGKLASRVGSLLLFLLAGLPILGLMQFFGGIDPDLVLAGFAATFATVLTLAAVGIAASVLSRKARDAIALTYLVAVAYVLLSLVAYGVAVMPYVRDWFELELFGYKVTAEDLAYPFVAGNPFYVVPYTMTRRAVVTVDVFAALRHYLLFHAVAIALLVTWAGLKLRPIALQQTFGSRRRSLWSRLRPARKPAAAGERRPRQVAAKVTRPTVGERPILWKEVFVDAGLKLGGFGKVVIFGLVGLSFVPMGFIFWFSIVDPSSWRNTGPWWSASRWDEFGNGMNVYLRAAGTVAACLVFLAVGIRGAGCISGERDRHTLDALLTTPLSARTIVWGKWWGCLLGMRWAWAWIFSLWVLALAAGGVHPVMFVAAMISLAVYASGAAWIGLYSSLHFKTTLRATMGTIVIQVFLGGGYFLIFLFCCILPMSFAGGGRGGENFDIIIDVLSSVSPPVNLAWLPIREFNRRELTLGPADVPYAPFWFFGLLAWGAFSFLLSQVCVNKFRQMANRVLVTPELPHHRADEA
jgi:ABC-type transport system involved in multi-copper enzyme maturation permease subunit